MIAPADGLRAHNDRGRGLSSLSAVGLGALFSVPWFSFRPAVLI